MKTHLFLSDNLTALRKLFVLRNTQVNQGTVVCSVHEKQTKKTMRPVKVDQCSVLATC